MTAPMLRVRAVSGWYPLIDEQGRTLMGRFCGRDQDRVALPDGELVPDTAYYRRGLMDGSLALVEGAE